MRAGLEALIAAEPGLEVVGNLSDQEVERPLTEAADVVLWAIDELDPDQLPDHFSDKCTGEDGTRAIVLLVDDWQPSAIGTLLQTGIRGILPTDATAAELTQALQAAAIGLTVIHPDILENWLSIAATEPRSSPPASSLTEWSPSEASLPDLRQPLTNREIEVLKMMAEGVGNKTIARRLGISEHTVKFHIGSIFSKLNASSRTEAVMTGARQGLIML